jgi:hypothetical protein
MTDDELFAILKAVDPLAMRLPPGMKNFARAVLVAGTVENTALRHLLFLAHGSPEHYLYGDDGERQCNTCMIDFNRDNPAEISQKITTYYFLKLARRQAETSAHTGLDTPHPVKANLVGRLNDLRDDVAEIQREALEAIARIRDMLRGDDGQAWKEAQKFLDRIDAKYKR